MVLVLAVVQLFSQLHALEHLHEHEGESHSELSCNLCILTADLENGAASPNLLSGTHSPSGMASVPTPCVHLCISPCYGFNARAPPVVRHFS